MGNHIILDVQEKLWFPVLFRGDVIRVFR